jgi:hypothetical protein
MRTKKPVQLTANFGREDAEKKYDFNSTGCIRSSYAIVQCVHLYGSLTFPLVQETPSFKWTVSTYFKSQQKKGDAEI